MSTQPDPQDRRRQPLTHLSQRSLSEVASFLAGEPCDVQFSAMAADPACLVARDRVVVLHPQHAHFGDFLLAATMLRQRAIIEALSKPTSPAAKSFLQRQARRVLDNMFPGHEDLGSDLHSATAEVTWDTLHQRDLQMSDVLGGGMQLSRRSFSVSNQSGLSALLDAARDGAFPQQRLPSFPEIDFVRYSIPMAKEIVTAPDHLLLEQWRTNMPEVVADGVRCFRDRAQILVDAPVVPQLVMEGSTIAPHALHDAYVAWRTGREVPVFEAPRTDPILAWDPERYIVVLGIDMAGMAAGKLLDPSPSTSLMMVFARIFQQLGVAVKVVGFWDHEVRTPDGKLRYLSMDVVAKDFAEPFDDAAALRMMHLADRKRHKAPSSVCHAAFHHEILAQDLVREANARSASVAQLYYFGNRWSPQFCTASRNAAKRMADACDQTMEAARRQMPTVQLLEGFAVVPSRVIAAATPQGWIAKHSWQP